MPHRPRSEEEKKSGDESGGVLPGNPKTEEERKQHTRPGTSHPTQKPGPWGDGFDWDSHFGNKDPSTTRNRDTPKNTLLLCLSYCVVGCEHYSSFRNRLPCTTS